MTVTFEGQVLPATGVAARTNKVFALVTAANPLGIELGDDENQRRNAAMARMFTAPLPACGESPEGDWAEPGFAVPFDVRALEAAQRFAQLAVFRVGPGSVEVVAVVGRGSEDLAREFVLEEVLNTRGRFAPERPRRIL